MAVLETVPQYYLYRHIRLDTNEVFYVGIGKRAKDDSYNPLSFNRACTKKGRNKYWTNIITKTEYEIDIILECDTAAEIKEKEVEFIKLYGRKDLGLGTLVNFTNGGDGVNGVIRTKETRKKLSDSKKGVFNPQFGKVHSKEWSELMSKKMSGEGNPNYKKSLSKKQKEINRQAQLGRKQSQETIQKRVVKLNKKVISNITGIEYESIKEAAFSNNIPYRTMSRWVINNTNGYKLL
jgi:hypothetical protein